MPVYYTAVKRFDPSCGEAWQTYLSWSGLSHLREAVTLDGILCPTAFQDLTAEDWKHNVQEDYKTSLFHDLDHVLATVSANPALSVLAVVQEPTPDDLRTFADPRFAFRGFDLVDKCGDISALLNCGGFDKAFSPGELSPCGLLVDLEHAKRAQQNLHANYPSEKHADCDLWAIWTMKS